MIQENQKYRVEALKICGFATMTPIGKLFLDLFDQGFQNPHPNLLIKITVSLILFTFGIILVQVGYEELDDGRI